MYRLLIRFLVFMLTVLQTIFKSRTKLIFENLALRQQLANYKMQKIKPGIHDVDRAFWIAFKRVWPKWRQALVIVKPETVIDWQQRRFKKYWRNISGSPPGRKKTNKEIRRLIHQMAAENRWGAPRILSELRMLGFAEVSQSTVSRYLRRFNANNPDLSKRRQSWKTFLSNSRHGIAAMDFFTVPTMRFKVLYGFFIIDHGRRRIIHTNVTSHPTARWVRQQLREAFPFDTAPRYLIYDRDAIFSSRVKTFIKSSIGIQPKQTSFRSPWQNGIAERWVKSVRTELLDHVIIFNETHLRRLLNDYVAYYNDERCHLALGRDAPCHRKAGQRSSPGDNVVALPRLNGLVHKYEWRKAA